MDEASPNPPHALQSTKDALCEHLFAVVRTFAPEKANKITGMITDGRSEIEIKMLLENPELLHQKVRKAVDVLQRCEVSNSQPTTGHCSSTVPKILDPEKEEIGNSLFHKVAEIESELCAQITGMLLEMDLKTLSQLVNDPVCLEVAVVRAKCEYLRECHPHTLPSRDELGDEIYQIVEKQYPTQAAKITGMLLELDEVRLQQLLDSPTELEHSIHQAYNALQSEKL